MNEKTKSLLIIISLTSFALLLTLVFNLFGANELVLLTPAFFLLLAGASAGYEVFMGFTESFASIILSVSAFTYVIFACYLWQGLNGTI